MKIKRTELNYYILFFIVLFSFFEIPYLKSNFIFFSYLYKILKVFSFLILMYIYFFNSKKIIVSKLLKLIFLYILSLLVSTLYNGADIGYFFNLSLNIISLCLITEFGLQINYKVFLNTLEFLLGLLLFINMFCIIAYPNGMYISKETLYWQNWFLGYKNSLVLYMFPALMTSFVNSYIKCNKLNIKCYFLLIICTISTLLCSSSAALVFIIMVILFIILKYVIYKTDIFNIKTYALSSLTLFIMIVILKVQNIFSYIIINFLKKDLTFTGRTVIWEYVIEFIKQKPIFGYGVENSTIRLLKTDYMRSYHAHNMLLEVTYKGGIVGMILFINIIYNLLKKLNFYKKENITKVVSWFIFILFGLFLTEAYNFSYIFYIFVFAYNIDYILEKNNKKI